MNFINNEETDIGKNKRREQNTNKDVSLMFSHIRFLGSRLSKYKKVDPFDLEAAHQKENQKQTPEKKDKMKNYKKLLKRLVKEQV